MLTLRPWLTLLLFTCGLLFATAVEAQLLREGDRVVLLGGTLIEREQVEGYWETQLTAALPFAATFRNLGWSGDTVWSESRGMFDPPAAGYARMLQQIAEINPTVVLIGYGNSEAFDGPDQIPAFKEQYQKLIHDLAAPERRFLLLQPLPMEAQRIPGRNRDTAEQQAVRYNEQIAAYAEAITEVAQATQSSVVDLRPAVAEWVGSEPLTDNGITLNGLGYWQTGNRLTALLVANQPAQGSTVDKPQLLSVSDWNVAADAPRIDRMRALIRRKNELVFHRWRPQNFTYLFGFRKHEQGNNAVEIPQFDPLVGELEAQIQALK